MKKILYLLILLSSFLSNVAVSKNFDIDIIYGPFEGSDYVSDGQNYSFQITLKNSQYGFASVEIADVGGYTISPQRFTFTSTGQAQKITITKDDPLVAWDAASINIDYLWQSGESMVDGSLLVTIRSYLDQEAPSSINSINVVDITGSSAKITWAGGSDDNFDHYEVYYDGKTYNTESVNKHTITGLSSCKLYSKQVKVSAVDKAGNKTSKTAQLNFSTTEGNTGDIFYSQVYSHRDFIYSTYGRFNLLPGFSFDSRAYSKRMQLEILSCSSLKSDGVQEVSFSEPDQTGLDQDLKNNDISKVVLVYPNPTKGKFDISGLCGNARIEIFDIAGKTIFKTATKEVKLHLNLSNNSKGIYTIQIIDQNGMHTEQLVLN